MRHSFWMGHPWGPLQTTSEQINQLSVCKEYLDTLKNTTISEACKYRACWNLRRNRLLLQDPVFLAKPKVRPCLCV